MHTISLSDLMMVRATAMGRVVADFNASGFSDIRDVLKATCERITDTRGIVQLSLRNSTQGWTTRHALYF
ncbi:MAG: hypothetical protein K2L96_08060 [Muribaculaceae bacterium]|nr:hypothetical protein [Muribaculaceae bacterium]